MPELFITVNGESLTAILRQAYWYENRQEWVEEVFKELEGITKTQKMLLLNGMATLQNNPENGNLILVSKNDTEFQWELQKHKKYIEKQCYVFAGKHVHQDVVQIYVKNLRQLYLRACHNPGFFISFERGRRFLMEIIDQTYNQILKQAGFTERKGKSYQRFVAELKCLVYHEAIREVLKNIEILANRERPPYPEVRRILQETLTDEWMSWEPTCLKDVRPKIIKVPEPKITIDNITEEDKQNLKIWSMDVPKRIKHQPIIGKKPINRKDWASGLHSILFVDSGLNERNIVQPFIDETITYFETYNMPEVAKWVKEMKVDLLNNTDFTEQKYDTISIQLNWLRGILHDEELNPTERPHAGDTLKKIIKIQRRKYNESTIY